ADLVTKTYTYIRRPIPTYEDLVTKTYLRRPTYENLRKLTKTYAKGDYFILFCLCAALKFWETIGLAQTKASARTVHEAIPDTILDFNGNISYGPRAGPQIAIAAAGKIAAESVNESQAEALDNTRSYDGLLGRSILAESVLQCYLESPSKQQETFTDFLAPLVAAIKPAVLKVAPLDTQDKREARPHPAEINTRIGRQLTENENTFLDGLIEVADDTVVKSFCSALTTIGDVFGSAFKKAGPVLTDLATIGLLLLLKALAGESSLRETNLDPLAHRAI
ncbi:hypothetical protein CHU98_g12271, partial [Xylaria longipes]